MIQADLVESVTGQDIKMKVVEEKVPLILREVRGAFAKSLDKNEERALERSDTPWRVVSVMTNTPPQRDINWALHKP